LRLGETEAVPRVSDLDALASSTAGKVEIETIEEGRDGQVVERIVKQAVLSVFKEIVPQDRLRDAVADFDGGLVIHTGDDVPSARFVEALGDSVALRDIVSHVSGEPGPSESAAVIASATEFVLEGLHLAKRLNKDEAGTRAAYRAR